MNNFNSFLEVTKERIIALRSTSSDVPFGEYLFMLMLEIKNQLPEEFHEMSILEIYRDMYEVAQNKFSSGDSHE